MTRRSKRSPALFPLLDNEVGEAEVTLDPALDEPGWIALRLGRHPHLAPSDQVFEAAPRLVLDETSDRPVAVGHDHVLARLDPRQPLAEVGTQLPDADLMASI